MVVWCSLLQGWIFVSRPLEWAEINYKQYMLCALFINKIVFLIQAHQAFILARMSYVHVFFMVGCQSKIPRTALQLIICFILQYIVNLE